jgi:hypothetical protein
MDAAFHHWWRTGVGEFEMDCMVLEFSTCILVRPRRLVQWLLKGYSPLLIDLLEL